ncbi:MAG: hypothetical protein GVY30_11670 [Chloroflexi bacterium]|nr:hypothetical protein [Chloroflexota bacterium]
MILQYFAQIEETLAEFPDIRHYELQKKVYNTKQGYISGRVVFEDGTRLDFVEVMDTDMVRKLKYRYHYMDTTQEIIFRYDNAPHYPEVSSFPHHKHTGDDVDVCECDEPSLEDVLLDIAALRRDRAMG